MTDAAEPPKQKSEALLALEAKFAAADERGKKILIARGLQVQKNNRLKAQFAAEGGFHPFVHYLWPILEPMTPLVDGWPLHALCSHLEAVARGKITRFLANVCPGFMKSLLTNVFLPAFIWGPLNQPHSRFLAFSYAASLTERDNRRFLRIITSPQYQTLYGNVFSLQKAGEVLISNDKTGWKLASSIGGVGTGERADYVLTDDPHNVKEAESEIVRNNTVTWFKEAMQNRLNDPKKSAIIVIMQRVNEGDVSGVIREEYKNYDILTIPMIYDSRDVINGVKHKTKIGWSDPRTTDGEIAWPERYDLASLEPYMSQPYLWCTPGESPVLMRDLSMKPISQIKEGDEIIGFTEVDRTVQPMRRRSLTVAVVKSISVSKQPIVKIRLESGAVIRCTENHKWYTARGHDGRPLYAPAQIGGYLMRICPDKIPILTDPEDIHAAGWLSGFFDGEGSAVLGDRLPGYPKRCTISFSQGAGKNLPICEKLEASLTRLGFKFNYRHRTRVPGQEPVRWYWIKNGNGYRGASLETFQRFLHVVKPTKWRDRMEAGGLSSRFISDKEKVISIENDGVETVYGLETTTGNYVVWGIASSNSSQYQQTPEPRGGAIIRRSYWQKWDADRFPSNISYILASADTAYTQKQSNDPSAMTIWGLFSREDGQPCVILMNAWRKRLVLHGEKTERRPGELEGSWIDRTQGAWGLCEWMAYTCRRFKVHKLLLEGKASGLSVEQELRRINRGEGWSIEITTPERDKVARAHASVSTFADNLVYAPNRQYARMVIDETAAFPFGRYKDLTDTVTQAIKHFRDNGLLLRRTEKARYDEEDRHTDHHPAPLYPV